MQARRGRRAVALGGEVPLGAARRAASSRGAGAAITLLYGVSMAFTMSKKARLALLKFSPEASADPDPSVLGLAGRVVGPALTRSEIKFFLSAVLGLPVVLELGTILIGAVWR